MVGVGVAVVVDERNAVDSRDDVAVEMGVAGAEDDSSAAEPNVDVGDSEMRPSARPHAMIKMPFEAHRPP